MKYIFILGNTPELAREEVKCLLEFKEILYQPPVLVLETEKEILFDKFGGTVKVAVEANLDESVTTDFGISDYTGKIDILTLSKKIKAETGKRYVLPSEGKILSSVVVKKQKLTELIFTNAGVFKTIWVQDFEDWGKRDYGRPQVEAHIGMLPPKVARMMINISQGKTILDPFCGVGTILMEGCELGLTMIGSDIDPKQITRTKANLESFNMTAKVLVADARRVKEQVDAIVTEADLGPRDDLNKLYLECFNNWKGMAKKIVIALPNGEIIDKAVSMGYILDAESFIYARPQAKIKRHILVFKDGTH